MTVLEIILLAIRWMHAIAAVSWVGGSIFYLVVLRPAGRRSPLSSESQGAIGEEFRGLVHTAMAVLLITGIILSASRLTGDGASLYYVITLGIKIALALYMFYVVWFLQKKASPDGPPEIPSWWVNWRMRTTGTNAVLIIGVIVFGLADLLDLLFETQLVAQPGS